MSLTTGWAVFLTLFVKGNEISSLESSCTISPELFLLTECMFP